MGFGMAFCLLQQKLAAKGCAGDLVDSSKNSEPQMNAWTASWNDTEIRRIVCSQ
jgi:hypothetical protein